MKKKSNKRYTSTGASKRGELHRLGKLNRHNKRFLQASLAVGAVVIGLYWVIGAESIFLFPALLSIALVVKYFRDPSRTYFTNGRRALPVRHATGIGSKR